MENKSINQILSQSTSENVEKKDFTEINPDEAEGLEGGQYITTQTAQSGCPVNKGCY